ncbi:Myb dna-binding domain containing protein [Pleurostoma richardsiae]|uniref:Myb dna-binding domain containing protein n=1 Tax=Pleurostoma richardsiae TaxID=41990 RepID=A0AA38RDP4_9PEZI|nr:Myb dna-binding domain containing protein [Pleurostoma richardsiae]
MSHPTIINLPQPSSNPDTPSEMPGTPTSTTTSLSALSTIAIKDGHRGTHGAPLLGQRGGHQHNSSINSLEAERADRISRLPGLSSVSGLRGQPSGPSQLQASGHYVTPASSGLPGAATSAQGTPNILGVPAYFDSNGQPVAVTKMSTVGSASATESVGGRTATDLSGLGLNDDGDQDMKDDEDLLSMDTNYREGELAESASGYMGGGLDPMDEELANRSVGGYEDRMSDDGSASLVGFGEGANSTISGPIYVRRPLPGGFGLERSASGLSEGAIIRRDRERFNSDRQDDETPVSASAVAERRAARMVDGVATDGIPARAGADQHEFVDTTTRSPVPTGTSFQPGQTSAIRETQQPHSHQQGREARELAERIIRDRFDANPALGSPGRGGEPLGQFSFEDRK